MATRRNRLSNVVMLPYNVGSQAAKNLQSELTTRLSTKVRLLYNDNRSRFVPSIRNHLIVWGSSKAPFRMDGFGQVLNNPSRIRIARNKLNSFLALKDAGNVSIPDFTQSRDEAARWIAEGSVVVARTKLSAHSGAGIVVCDSSDQLPDCRLYTKYVKKKKEFRVHVVGGEVIDVQQKKQKSGVEVTNFQVRNHQNGWIYAREDIQEPDDLRANAINAVLALGLDFGAVDCVFNEHQNRTYVLEVNTAPGLEGSSVQYYANALLRMLQNAQAN